MQPRHRAVAGLLAGVLLGLGATWIVLSLRGPDDRDSTDTDGGAGSAAATSSSLAATTVDQVDTATTAASSTSVVVTSPDTTETTVPVVPLPDTLVMGRVVEVSRGSGFRAAALGRPGYLVGPMTLTIEGYGEVEIPAETIIDQLCLELGIEPPGEQPAPLPPCYVRVDVGPGGRALDLIVLQYSRAEDIDFESTYVNTEVIGATASTVIVSDYLRDKAIAWPIAPGVVFWCSGIEWEPPTFPREPDLTAYELTVDTTIGAVTRMVCRASF